MIVNGRLWLGLGDHRVWCKIPTNRIEKLWADANRKMRISSLYATMAHTRHRIWSMSSTTNYRHFVGWAFDAMSQCREVAEDRKRANRCRQCVVRALARSRMDEWRDTRCTQKVKQWLNRCTDEAITNRSSLSVICVVCVVCQQLCFVFGLVLECACTYARSRKHLCARASGCIANRIEYSEVFMCRALACLMSTTERLWIENKQEISREREGEREKNKTNCLGTQRGRRRLCDTNARNILAHREWIEVKRIV